MLMGMQMHKFVQKKPKQKQAKRQKLESRWSDNIVWLLCLPVSAVAKGMYVYFIATMNIKRHWQLSGLNCASFGICLVRGEFTFLVFFSQHLHTIHTYLNCWHPSTYLVMARLHGTKQVLVSPLNGCRSAEVSLCHSLAISCRWG